MSEAARIADQLRRAFDGEAWHGDSVFEILQGIRAAQAAARPIKNGHTIWELLLHIAAWDGAVLRRMGGVADVRYDWQWLNRLMAAISLIRGVGLALGSILAIAAALTVANVVRLALESRKDELWMIHCQIPQKIDD